MNAPRTMPSKLSIGRRPRAILFGLILVLTLVFVGTGYGQAPAPQAPAQLPPPQAPAAPAPADNGVMPFLWKIDPLGLGTNLPTTCSQYEDRNGPLLNGNPLLDSPPGSPGWVGGVELGVVVPHVMNRLFNSFNLASGAGVTVQLPSAQIETAMMPRFELGYRFGQAAGEVILSYRFVTGQATNFSSDGFVTPSFPGGVFVRSRLDLNTIDLDYGSCEPLTIFGVDMKWRVGIRSLFEYNDSQANNGVTAQSTSNDYYGFGPHAMVDFHRPIGNTGLALFGRVEAAMLWGSLTQNYTDSVTAGGATDFGQLTDRIVSQVTTIAFQAGVTWTSPWNPNFHVSAGYIFEHFFDLGSLAVGVAAREELDIEGGFVRLEWRY